MSDIQKQSNTSLEELNQNLELLSNVLQGHDHTIVQVIASLNATQALLVEKGILAQEDLMTGTEEELKRINARLVDKKQAQQEST